MRILNRRRQHHFGGGEAFDGFLRPRGNGIAVYDGSHHDLHDRVYVDRGWDLGNVHFIFQWLEAVAAHPADGFVDGCSRRGGASASGIRFIVLHDSDGDLLYFGRDSAFNGCV